MNTDTSTGMNTDYGHDLLFGTFVTPTNHPAHQALGKPPPNQTGTAITHKTKGPAVTKVTPTRPPQ